MGSAVWQTQWSIVANRPLGDNALNALLFSYRTQCRLWDLEVMFRWQLQAGRSASKSGFMLPQGFQGTDRIQTNTPCAGAGHSLMRIIRQRGLDGRAEEETRREGSRS